MENEENKKKVLLVMSVWNEINYLPLKVKYCEENKLDIYVIDNMSDDGTWEWLQENNIPSHRFDTGGAFTLTPLQQEMVKVTNQIKPYWVIYNGCDLFPMTDKPLYDAIMEVDEQGYNNLTLDLLRFYNTGETHETFDPTNTFYYIKTERSLSTIYKYQPGVKYSGDFVLGNGLNKNKQIDGVMLEYGDTKTAEEREKTLARRKKAWTVGEPRGHGTHYLVNEKYNWLRNKDDLTHIKDTKYHKYLIKLQDIFKTP